MNSRLAACFYAVFLYLCLLPVAHANGDRLECSKTNSKAELDRAALAYYRENKFEQAVNCYQALLHQVPDDVSTLNNLALALHGNHQFQQSLAMADKAIELAKTDKELANAFYNKGKALEFLGEPLAAYQAFKKSNEIEAHPERQNAVGRTDLVVKTQAFRHRPEILTQIPRILEGFSSKELQCTKDKSGVSARLFKALKSGDGAVELVEPEIFGVDKDHPKLKKYRKCRSRTGRGIIPYDGLHSLGDYGYGLYRIGLNYKGDAYELLFGSASPDYLRLNEFAKIGFVDLSECLFKDALSFRSDYAFWYGSTSPVISIREVVRFESEVYLVEIASSSGTGYLRGNVQYKIMRISESELSKVCATFLS